MWRALGIVWSYLWTIGSSLLGLLVVWYVLSRVYDRTEIMVVSLAGVLYCTVNGAWLTITMNQRQLSQQIADRTVAIQRHLDPSWITDHDWWEARRLRDSDDIHYYVKLMVVAVASVLVAVSCLFRFFAAL